MSERRIAMLCHRIAMSERRNAMLRHRIAMSERRIAMLRHRNAMSERRSAMLGRAYRPERFGRTMLRAVRALRTICHI